MTDYDETTPDHIKYPDRYAHFEKVYKSDAENYLNEWHNKGYTGDYVPDAIYGEDTSEAERETWGRLKELQVKADVLKARQATPRADLLDEAKKLVTGDRNNQYGPPTQDFQRAADAMTAMGYQSASGPIRAHDVAVLVSLIKISRLQWTPQKRDHWADLAGYAACGYECTLDEEDR